MTRVDDSCAAEPLPDFEQPVSLPPSAPAAEPAAEPASAADGDTFAPLTRAPAFLSSSPATGRSPALPEAPEPPRTKLPPGCSPEEARAVRDADWERYSDEYGRYLQRIDELLRDCDSLERLRQIEPEPPDAATMRLVGLDREADALQGRYRDFFGKKVDRGYELLGERAPGSLQLTVKAKLKAGVLGQVGIEKGFKASTDGKVGLTKERAFLEGKADLGAVKLGAIRYSDGETSASASVGGVGVHASSKGELGVKVDGGMATYAPREATLGATVTILDTGPGIASLTATAALSVKGLSAKDAQRALDGWLVPRKDEDAGERWLREQQLRAQLSR